MSRLLTVVNERNKIKNEFRAFLEDKYMWEQKQKELEFQQEQKQAKLESSPEKEHKKSKREEHKENLELLKQALSTSPNTMLESKDVELLSNAYTEPSQKEILRTYIKNYSDLSLKQRRRVMGFINAQRAKHAKEIFLKELNTLSHHIKHKPLNTQNQNQQEQEQDAALIQNKHRIKQYLENI